MGGGNPLLSHWYRLYKAQTRAESAIELAVALLGVPYRFQHPLLKHRVIADFALPLDGIIIEVDGASHSSATARAKDAERDAKLSSDGWMTLRITNEAAIANPFDSLDAALAGAGLPLRTLRDNPLTPLHGGPRGNAQRRLAGGGVAGAGSTGLRNPGTGRSGRTAPGARRGARRRKLDAPRDQGTPHRNRSRRDRSADQAEKRRKPPATRAVTRAVTRRRRK